METPRSPLIGVYVHIPYCRTICPYCDFVKRPIKGTVPPAFLNALCSEIDAFDGASEVDGVFFGGGTPSLIAVDDFARVMDALRARFSLTPDAEVTLEANPDDVTPELMNAWTASGVNRISMGVQSFNDEALRYLGRRHDADGARRACGLVAERLPNWNMDLIFGVPPLEEWRATLETCRSFQPAHVSAYGLTYEAGTPFGKRANEAIDDETYLNQFHEVDAVLDEYERYEVSNLARPGFQCALNLRYWHNEEYAGFGPAAYSYLSGVRSRNCVKTDEYIAAPGSKQESIRLSEREVRVETLIQHFRLKRGLEKAYYEARFGASLDSDFGPVLQGLVARGLLLEAEGFIRPTPKGFELNNEIGLALVG
ncbi:MAG: radical SAM family heme chaperone HemW [Candidatus Hydrogenedentes bacterium]|nr:radical SAM family heme chaperone HemW [Candidatus Hydrogenedentota bacterium]